MSDLGSFRCIITLVPVGDTSGLKFQCPPRCMEIQIYLKYTSGWGNIGLFRCIAKECLSKIHRNSVIHIHPDVYQLISRDSTRFPLQRIPAQAGKNKQNTSEFSNSYPSRCIQINFPRIYSLSLVAYPRASRQKQTKYIGNHQF